jgi:hypothetical protein
LLHSHFSLIVLSQLTQLRSKQLHQAVDRFRHDSSILKITAHVLYKTSAIVTAAISASYIIVFIVGIVTFLLLLLAALNYFSFRPCLRFTASWNLPTLVTFSCKILAFLICFSLPIFIQQGDIDSSANSDSTVTDDPNCIFYYSLFPRSKNESGLRTDFHCDQSFWTVHTRNYFRGKYPTVFYTCPLRMSRSTLYGPALMCNVHARTLRFFFSDLTQVCSSCARFTGSYVIFLL